MTRDYNTYKFFVLLATGALLSKFETDTPAFTSRPRRKSLFITVYGFMIYLCLRDWYPRRFQVLEAELMNVLQAF
jgi:hypothetical protein